MVMGRVRATSYVRRTLSQPMNNSSSSSSHVSGGNTSSHLVGGASGKRRISSVLLPHPHASPLLLQDQQKAKQAPDSTATGAGAGSTGGGGVCTLLTTTGGVGAPSRQLHLGLLASEGSGGTGLGGEDRDAFSSSSSSSSLGSSSSCGKMSLVIPREHRHHSGVLNLLGVPGGASSSSGTVIDEEGGEDEEDLAGFYHFSLQEDLQRIGFMLSGKLNVLLLFVPLSFWSVLYGWSSLLVFISNFLALIPLASLLGTATEELALHTGEIVGGLLNATFGNAVEMIVSVQALRVGLLNVVQGTMLGSILSNLLLVLGMSFFAGGVKFHVQKFNEKGATCSVTLLLLSCMSIVIPTVAAYGSFFTYDINLRSYQPAPPAYYTKKTPYHSPSNGQLHMDTLKSLKEDKEREDDKVNESPTKMPILKSTHNASGEGGDFGMSAANLPTYDIIKISRTIAVLIGLTYCLFLFFQLYTHLSLFRDDECGDEEWPSMSWEAATLLLFIITLLISIHSEYLVGSIHDVVTTYGLPESFIGVILLPIVGNAAEHLTAVTVAMKNKVDLAMGVAVGSSAQIALFVFPFTVCVGWFLDQPLTLAVQPLNALVLLMAVLVAMAIVQDGESNWLEGVMLMSAYLMIAIVFWYNGAAAPPAPPPLPSSSLGGNEDASTYAPGAKNLS